MSGNLALFCERMKYWCDVADLGYDQTERGNIGNGGESDCSSLVIHALQEAGFDTGSASYTGDLSANLTTRGGVRLQPNIPNAKPGDILLSDEHHVAVVVNGYGGGAMVAEAGLDENDNIYYGRSGDQTGLETRVRSIYVFSSGGNCFLRYEGEEDDMTPDDLMYKNISTKDSGNIPVGQAGSGAFTYSKECATQLAGLSAAVEALAASKGADATEIANTVKKAVDAKLKTIKIPEIDYEALATAIAEKLPAGADAAAIAKTTANELYKRLKA